MRVTVRLLPLILLALFGFAGVARGGAESAPASAPDIVTAAEFRKHMEGSDAELGLEGLKELTAKGPVVILDVRGAESFARRHLKGSVNAPLTGLTEKTLPDVAPDKNVPVVLVCDYSFMPVRMLAMTLQAYPLLKANGYRQVHRLNLWKAASPGGAMVSDAEQEKALAFEGTAVTPRAE